MVPLLNNSKGPKEKQEIKTGRESEKQWCTVTLGSPEQPFLQALSLNISLSAISAMHGII